MQSARAICGLSCFAVPHFSTVSHKRHDFREKKLLNVKRVFGFFLQLLFETFRILRVIQRDIIINVRTSSSKIPVTRVRS